MSLIPQILSCIVFPPSQSECAVRTRGASLQGGTYVCTLCLCTCIPGFVYSTHLAAGFGSLDTSNASLVLLPSLHMCIYQVSDDVWYANGKQRLFAEIYLIVIQIHFPGPEIKNWILTSLIGCLNVNVVFPYALL